ncbi:MAG: periplasmic protein TonB [Acidobacteriaceae bacterium]|nr:periplasmic protein TonB [Acidobacteriaceae bacterium]
MPNQESSRHAADTFFPVSSSALLYGGRERVVRPVPARARAQKPLGPEAIWGQFNNYRSNGLAGSAAVHVILLALLLASATFGHHIVQTVEQYQTVTLIAPSLDSYALPVAKKIASGGGGGGDHDKLPAIKGRLPKPAMQQITPPQIIVRNEHPRLAVEPTVVIPPQVRLASNHMPNLGNPSAAALPSAPPSNGTGSGGGIGSGSGGGVGVGHGPGVGAGSGGGIGGGVFKVGGGISAPQALSTPDPEYTEEARNAKTQGTCILWLIVDDQGRPRDIRVVRGLGFGLDTKAIEAVKQWRFQPALKDGRPVNVQISVEVGFRLY